MTAPIINELIHRYPVRLTLRTTLPEHLLKSRIDGDFNVIPENTDFGMVMHSSLDVDIPESAKAYQAFHENYEEKVLLEIASLQAIKPDLILANIPYLTIDASARCGIPCVAYCSLNWLEIFDHYFNGVFSGEEKIKKQIADAYNKADVFLCPAPSMSMPQLKNIQKVGPVAKINTNTSITSNAPAHKLRDKIGRVPKVRFVLITPGGVPTSIPVDDWPANENIVWICSWPIKSSRDDVFSCEEIDLSFNEILASCDAVITKPGYGAVTETVCNQVPALYVKRGDWPEEPCLVDWWHQHGCVDEISRDDLFSGNVINQLKLLWQKKSKPLTRPDGINDVCDVLSKYLHIKSPV